MKTLHPKPLVLSRSCGFLAVDGETSRNSCEQPTLWLLECRRHKLWDGPDNPSGLGLALLQMLNQDEQLHWSAQNIRADRDRCLLGRAALRCLLSQRLNIAPVEVPLKKGLMGKPMLDSMSSPRIQFNLSHASDLVLIGLHHHNPIGVDLESIEAALSIQNSGDLLDVARQMFHPEIVDSISLLPFDQQPEAFLLQWCQLEAQLKAHGTGLTTHLIRRREGSYLMQQNYSTVNYAVALPADYIGSCSMIPNSSLQKPIQAHSYYIYHK